MKRKKIGIKWQVFMWLAIFVVVTISLLWVFQVVFLDDFYKFIKTNEIKNAASEVIENVDNTEQIDSVAQKNDITVLIYNTDGTPVYSTNSKGNNRFSRMTAEELAAIATDTIDKGGVVIEYYNMNQFAGQNENSVPRLPENDVPQPPEHTDDKGYQSNDGNIGKGLHQWENFGEGMSYMSVSRDNETGNDILVLICSQITPVTATVKTLQIQLVCVTVVLLLVAILLAVIIAKIISKPIEKISDSAAELARANYEVSFDETGYKEVSKLGETLNYAAHELNKTENLRRELIANVSHDLRTPLTLIAGYGEAIRDLPGENNTENVQIIIDESRRLTTLVNDMLDLSKLQSDTDLLAVEAFDLTALVREILGRFSKLVAEDGFTFSFEAQRNVIIKADKTKISQVVYNFLTNAVNYSGDSKEVIVRQTVNENKVRISVVDKGEGIEDAEIPYIWDRYYKSNKPHKRAVVGTGIGLSIVKKILEKHGAKYGVESVIGQGSTFWFEFDIEK